METDGHFTGGTSAYVPYLHLLFSPVSESFSHHQHCSSAIIWPDIIRRNRTGCFFMGSFCRQLPWHTRRLDGVVN